MGSGDGPVGEESQPAVAVGEKRPRMTKAEVKAAKRGIPRKHTVEVRVGRKRVDVAPLARAEYGVMFDCNTKGKFEPLQRGGGVECTCKRAGAREGEGAEASTSGTQAGGDNRNLLANQANQALSPEEILALKKSQGGAAAIAALAASSSTFDSKTVFSQMKYIKKKAERHLPRCVVHKFCAWRLALRVWDQRGKFDPPQYPRAETLAYALTAAGVSPGALVICVELRPGPLGVAVRERLAGTGDACFVHCSGPLPIHVEEKPFLVTAEARAGGPSLGYASIAALLSEEIPANSGMSSLPVSRPAPLQGWVKEARATAIIAQLPKGVDAAAFLSALLRFLRPGHAFALYGVDSAQLAAAAVHVRSSGEAKLVQLTEGFMHSYQVLPERSHPSMTGSASGGYLLSGYKFLPS